MRWAILVWLAMTSIAEAQPITDPVVKAACGSIQGAIEEDKRTLATVPLAAGARAALQTKITRNQEKLAACVAEANNTKARLDAERERQRIAAEKDRQEQEAQAAAEAERAKKAEADAAASDERIGKIRSDKKQMALVFGAILCGIDFQRRQALEEIAKEKKYARLGGMVDKVKLYNLQRQVRFADERAAGVREKLKQPIYAGVKPVACASKDVQRVLVCHDNEGAANCGQREADYNRFVSEWVDADMEDE